MASPSEDSKQVGAPTYSGEPAETVPLAAPPHRRGERLVLHVKPSATLAPVSVQEPLLPEGPRVERFSTARGKLFERHTSAAGAEIWYKVERG